MVNLQTKVLDPRLGTKFPLPSYATEGSAGLDLRAMTKHPITLGAGQVELIHTGISIYINNPGYAGLVLPRSGLGHHLGVVLGNLVGLIDSDFQGEIMLSVWNRGTKSVRIDVGDRIAQLVLIPVVQARLQLTTEFAESGRGLQGLSELNAATCAQ